MAWQYTECDNGGLLWRLGTIDLSKRGTVGFDLDWTLIKPESGRKHPLSRTDWIFLFPGTVEKVRLLAKTRHIAIFSNQTKSVKTAGDRKALCEKLDAVVAGLGVPVSVFVSCGYCPYRKPKPTMWRHWMAVSGVPANVADMYVGDAAGRPKVGSHSKDFAATDHTFARNAGVEFVTPEQMFLGLDGAIAEVPEPHCPWTDVPHIPHPLPLAAWNTLGDGKELVLMVGAPGSGKSAWIRKMLGEYSRVSQDVLGNRDRCLRAVRDALVRNKKVVVDNTNPAAETRALYIDLARQAGAPVRCVHITTPKKMAEHLNALREEHPDDGVRKPRVSPIGETMYWSKFKEPEMEEGFSEVHRVGFEYSAAETPEELFQMWHR
jgi:bifunctional polynucleotide phosphatase/kinase